MMTASEWLENNS